MQIYKSLEQSKDYLEKDLQNAVEYNLTDDEYNKFSDVVKDIQKLSVRNNKVNKARLEPSYIPIQMPQASEWKVDENLADFIKITEIK